MIALRPEDFCPLPETPPIVLCPPPMRRDAHRAIAESAKGAEVVLKNLRRRALELDLEVFAQRVAHLTLCLGEARGDLERCPR